MTTNSKYRSTLLIVSIMLLSVSGCLCCGKKKTEERLSTKQTKNVLPFQGQLPHELAMVTMPEYMIEPPDILRIDALRIVPPSPYHVEPLDGLMIQVANLPQEDPISGLFVVDPNGTITLGPNYGPPLKVIGLTLEEAKTAVEDQLKRAKILNPKASVALGQSRALQQIRGEHLVRPDGTVGLGTYGSVRVVGLTMNQ